MILTNEQAESLSGATPPRLTASINTMNYSASIVVGPENKNCRYIAKLIRAGQPIPAPAKISEMGIRAISAKLANNGDEELLPGDVLIEVEQIEPHRRNYRCRMVFAVGPDKLRYIEPISNYKHTAKANGLPVEYLAGAGPLAGCVRIMHAMRLGVAWE